MSQEYSRPVAAALSWSEAWIGAITRPSVETYERIANDPTASSGRAFTWVAVAGVIGYIIQIGGLLLLGGGMVQMGSVFITLLCGALIAVVGAVIGLIIVAGITQAIAGALGGTGSFEKLAYAIAAYSAPMSIITAVIYLIPCVNLALLLLAIYGIVLNVIAVKAVNQFGWGEAIASSVIILVGICILAAVVVIVILALLGPAIGNIFSNIVNAL